MTDNNTFLIDAETNVPENHISEDNSSLFEFSKTTVWDQNFFAPESGTAAFDVLFSELGEIKFLISGIKDLLADIFETNTRNNDIL